MQTENLGFSELAKKAAELMQRPELQVAVEWWTAQLLSLPEHDAGDAGISLTARSAARSICKPLEQRQVRDFKASLLAILATSFAESWREHEPNWNSYGRALSCDYGPCRRLTAALEAAGIEQGELRLPIKTMMWTNPGKVEVRQGYGGKTETIYPA